MKNSEPEFYTTSGFLIAQTGIITDFDLQIITKLYLPMIGANAFALYQWLNNNLPDQVIVSQRTNHNDMIDALNLNIPMLINARKRLESLGLLSTHYHKDAIGEVYIYTIAPPQSPASFFKDQLLSNFLFSLIGDTAYYKLQKEFALKKLPMPLGSNISANFTDVFGRTTTHPEIQNSQIDNLKNDKLEITANDDFDFNYVKNQLKKLGVSQSNIEQNHDFIVALHLVYGLNEVDINRIVEPSITLDQHLINQESIKVKLLKNASINRVETLDAPATLNEVNVNRSTTDKDNQLIKLSEQLSPVEFISNLKAQLGGYVSSSEKIILQNLTLGKVLTPATINILIYQILVSDQKASLTQSLADAIANQWIRAGVKTPQDAIKAIRKFRTAKSTKPISKPNYRKVETPVDYTPKQEQKTTIDFKETIERLKKINRETNS